MNRQEKEACVAELHEKLERTKTVVLTDYRGLKVTEITDLRQKLKEAGVEFRVVKNSLTKLAVQDTSAAGLADYLSGPCALALSCDDELTSTRLLMEYAKGNDKLEVKVGILAGRLMQQEEIRKVIGLPPKEVLQAQLLGIMATLPSRFLGVLNGVSRDFVSVLAATPRSLVAVLKAIQHKNAPAS